MKKGEIVHMAPPSELDNWIQFYEFIESKGSFFRYSDSYQLAKECDYIFSEKGRDTIVYVRWTQKRTKTRGRGIYVGIINKMASKVYKDRDSKPGERLEFPFHKVFLFEEKKIAYFRAWV